MIVKATRIATSSGAGKVGRHVFDGKDNDAIEILDGAPSDLDDMVIDARHATARFAIRHVVISPAEAITREQSKAIAEAWMREFRAADHPYVLVEHQKPRVGGRGSDLHWHLLVAEVNPSTGRVLSSSFSFARNEKIARLAELHLGHALTPGRHNRAVIAALKREGRAAEAAALHRLAVGTPPSAAFSSDAHQTVKRKGLCLPHVRGIVRDAWKGTSSRTEFVDALAAHGLRVESGRKKLIVVGVGPAGERVEFGSLDRLAKAPAGTVNKRMNEEQDHEQQREAGHSNRGLGEGSRTRGAGSAPNGQADRANADGGAKRRRDERHGADCGAPRASHCRPAPVVGAGGKHRLGRIHLETGATARLRGKLSALRSGSSQFGAMPSGAGGLSMEAAIHRLNGFIGAEPTASPALEAGTSNSECDPEALAATVKAWVASMGGAVRSQRAKRSTVDADIGQMVVAYAACAPSTPYPGLNDEFRDRVDALPAHERESLSRTGRHYDGLKSLSDHEARAIRATHIFECEMELSASGALLRV